MKLYTPIMVLITARLVVFHDHQLHSPTRIVFPSYHFDARDIT